MTLLLTLFAAIIVSIKWYKDETARKLEAGFLALMLWGASLMWMCDAIMEYLELREEYFTPGLEDMINDSFLGLSVIALAFIIWFVRLLVKDPMKRIRRS